MAGRVAARRRLNETARLPTHPTLQPGTPAAPPAARLTADERRARLVVLRDQMCGPPGRTQPPTAAAARAPRRRCVASRRAAFPPSLSLPPTAPTRLLAHPSFRSESAVQLNGRAVAHLRAGDDERCVAAFALLFRKLREGNLAHRQLYAAHCNRAAAYLGLGLWEEALWDAGRCAALAARDFARFRDPCARASFVRSFARRGFALLGLGRGRGAAAAFEEGLLLDPGHAEMRRGAAEAARAVRDAALSGRDWEGEGEGGRRLALPAPARRERISNLPAATPLHALRAAGAALPVRLLTPFQAENDHHLKGARGGCGARGVLSFNPLLSHASRRLIGLPSHPIPLCV